MTVNPVALCLRGLVDASARFDAAEQTPEVDELALAQTITEAALWAGSLDELWGGKGDDQAYAERRDADADGLVIPGLRWARNRGIHQVTAVHESVDGASFPIRWPMRYRSVKWRVDVDTTGARGGRLGEERYRAHLVGAQVWVTLRSAQEFLEREAQHRRA